MQKLLIGRLRPKLEPLIKKYDVAWADIKPALELLSIQRLTQACEDAQAFLSDLMSEAGPVAIKFLVAQLRPKIEPIIVPMGLIWDDIKSAMELVDTVDELRDALADPAAFMSRLASASGPAAKRFLLAKIRPFLEPITSKKNLKWPDVVLVLNLVDSMDELQLALDNAQAFFERLLSKAGAALKRLVLAMLQPVMEPRIWKMQLTWEDVEPVFVPAAVYEPTSSIRGLKARPLHICHLS